MSSSINPFILIYSSINQSINLAIYPSTHLSIPKYPHPFFAPLTNSASSGLYPILSPPLCLVPPLFLLSPCPVFLHCVSVLSSHFRINTRALSWSIMVCFTRLRPHVESIFSGHFAMLPMFVLYDNECCLFTTTKTLTTKGRPP